MAEKYWGIYIPILKAWSRNSGGDITWYPSPIIAAIHLDAFREDVEAQAALPNFYEGAYVREFPAETNNQ